LIRRKYLLLPIQPPEESSMIPTKSWKAAAFQDFTTPEELCLCPSANSPPPGRLSRYLRPGVDLSRWQQKAVIVNAAPRFEPGGRFAGALAVLTDITERKKEEKALAEAKMNWKKLLPSWNKETAISFSWWKWAKLFLWPGQKKKP